MPHDKALKTLRGKTELRTFMKSVHSEVQPRVELAFWAPDVEDAYNVGGLIRLADAAGATLVVLSGRTPCPPHPQIHVTSMGHHRRVNWEYFERHTEAASFIRESGFAMIAIELAAGAESFVEFSYPSRTCLVLGNEKTGLTGGQLKECSGAVFIPMVGKGRSLNVHVSAAVVAFQALFGTS